MNWLGTVVLIVLGAAGFVLGARAAASLGSWLAGPWDLHDVWEDEEL